MEEVDKATVSSVKWLLEKETALRLKQNFLKKEDKCRTSPGRVTPGPSGGTVKLAWNVCLKEGTGLLRKSENYPVNKRWINRWCFI